MPLAPEILPDGGDGDVLFTIERFDTVDPLTLYVSSVDDQGFDNDTD